MLYLFPTLWAFSANIAAISVYCLLNKLNPKWAVPFSDTLHKAKIHKNFCNKKKLRKYFIKNGEESHQQKQKQASFGFFFANWFNGFIVLLNNSNISNFILGHNDLKLDCLCYCYCCCLIFCISIFDYLCFSIALHFIFFLLVI